MNTWYPTAASLPQALLPRRKRKEKEETKLPEVSSPGEDLTGSLRAMWEGRCLLIGPAAQTFLHKTEVCAQLLL